MDSAQTEKEHSTVRTCGIVMPISELDGCTTEHWADVKEIINEASEEAQLKASLVSDADPAGLIHGRIVQNLFTSDLVVCDVSGSNPNVMFELGMRLAFDKPTVIIKDDETPFLFDTGVIEHLEYPRSLHFQTIRAFRSSLANKMRATLDAAGKPEYTSFLAHFPNLTASEVPSMEVTPTELILRRLDSIDERISRDAVVSAFATGGLERLLEQVGQVCIKGSNAARKRFEAEVRSLPGCGDLRFRSWGKGHWHFHGFEEAEDREEVLQSLAKEAGLESLRLVG